MQIATYLVRWFCRRKSFSLCLNIWFEAQKESWGKFKWLSIGIISKWNIIIPYQMRINVAEWLIHIECPTHIKHSHLSSMVKVREFYSITRICGNKSAVWLKLSHCCIENMQRRKERWREISAHGNRNAKQSTTIDF